MKILLTEHASVEVYRTTNGNEVNTLAFNEEIFSQVHKDNIRVFKREQGKDIYPFLLEQKNADTFHLKANYYIGADWLVKDRKFIQVDPKINTKLAPTFEALTDIPDPEIGDYDQLKNKLPQAEYLEVDYLKMLLDIMSTGLPAHYTDDLVLIDWHTSQIPVTQQEDRLTPFLVVQFLQLLKAVVRKGLKKSYYKVRENLNNRIKGKILIGPHLKQNLFKNRLTQTYCEYQVFGEDNIENRFLKEVLRFSSSYIENNKPCFGNNVEAITNLVNHCRPAFEHIGSELNEDQLKQVRYNLFFKEYKEAITIGRHILKKFAYNISETSNVERKTPPFWIDMPRLFELYCYMQLLKTNPKDKHHIHYQFSTYGNVLDLLISKPDCQMVIDAKYKLHYQQGQIHQDIRQIAGYARLKKVRSQLRITDDRNIDCLIVYPDLKATGLNCLLNDIIKTSNPIAAYDRVYKLGIPLPLKQRNC